MISIKNLKKYYPGAASPVIDIPQLELPNNTYWLKGINGSGKTTFIKLVAGLLPFQGELLVDGLNILKDRIEYRRVVNYAEAEPVYPAFLTGTDLINFYRETKKAPVLQIKQLIERLDAGHYLHQKTVTYSSGMTKKLSLILALMGNAKLILLDEPLITLDVKAIEAIIALIGEYHKDGACFLMASHQEFDQSLPFSPVTLSLTDKRII